MNIIVHKQVSLPEDGSVVEIPFVYLDQQIRDEIILCTKYIDHHITPRIDDSGFIYIEDNTYGKYPFTRLTIEL